MKILSKVSSIIACQSKRKKSWQKFLISRWREGRSPRQTAANQGHAPLKTRAASFDYEVSGPFHVALQAVCNFLKETMPQRRGTDLHRGAGLPAEREEKERVKWRRERAGEWNVNSFGVICFLQVSCLVCCNFRKCLRTCLDPIVRLAYPSGAKRRRRALKTALLRGGRWRQPQRLGGWTQLGILRHRMS